jgi:hypothetical protein
MCRLLFTLAVVAGAVVGWPNGGWADDKKTGDDTKTAKATEVTAEAKAVLNLRMGFELAKYSREHKMPLGLITAARIIGTTPMKEQAGEKTPEGLKPFDSLAEAAALLDEALKMEGVTDADKKLADETKKEVSVFKRGAAGGAKVYEGTVGPGQTRSYQIRFVIGQLATINVRNITMADLDLYVTCNASGWSINDRRSDDDCKVAFTVGTVSTQGFTVRVVNYSTDKTGRYVLFTN